MSNLTASVKVGFNTEDSFETMDMSVKPCLEYALKGPALLYVEYEMEVEEFKKDNHKFRFGIDVKAF
jgi:hypothetical protein